MAFFQNFPLYTKKHAKQPLIPVLWTEEPGGGKACSQLMDTDPGSSPIA